MKYNNLTIGFGIAFGLGMLPLAYLNLALGIVLAFAGKGDFSIMIYVFVLIIGLLSAVFAWLAKQIKKQSVTTENNV